MEKRGKIDPDYTPDLRRHAQECDHSAAEAWRKIEELDKQDFAKRAADVTKDKFETGK